MKSTEKEQNFSFPTTKHNLVVREKPSVAQALAKDKKGKLEIIEIEHFTWYTLIWYLA